MTNHYIKAGLDVGALFSVAAAWAGVLNPILTMVATALTITWVSVQLYSWWKRAP